MSQLPRAEIFELNLTMTKVMRSPEEQASRNSIIENIMAQIKMLELDQRLIIIRVKDSVLTAHAGSLYEAS